MSSPYSLFVYLCTAFRHDCSDHIQVIRSANFVKMRRLVKLDRMQNDALAEENRIGDSLQTIQLAADRALIEDMSGAVIDSEASDVEQPEEAQSA